MGKPSLLLIVPTIPAPPTTGGDVRICALIDALAGGWDIHLRTFYAAGQTDANAELLRGNCASVEVVKGTRETWLNDAVAPPVIDAMYSSAFAAQLQHDAMTLKPSLVLVEFWFMAQYFEQVPELRRCRTAVTAIDCEWVRRERLGEIAAAAAYRSYEARFLGLAETVLALTEPDAANLRTLLPGKRVLVKPTGIPVRPDPPAAQRQGVLFVGAFDHQPNVDGLLWYVRDIWPQVRARVNSATLTVVGRRPPESVRALHGQDGIAVAGEVPDTAPYLRAAAVMVAPLLSGSGLKTKIVEALGYGLPVVTTGVGAEGLANAAGIIAVPAAEQAATLCALLTDDGQRETLGAAATACFAREFSMAVYTQRLRALLQELVA